MAIFSLNKISLLAPKAQDRIGSPMHLDRSGKVDRLAGEPLDPGPQGQMFALDLLHVPLARLMLGGIEMSGVRAPIIGVRARDAKRLE